MAQERHHTVLRRKAEAGKPVPDGLPINAERALTQALTKVAQDMFGLPLQVRGLRESRRTLADLPEALEDLSLLAILEGPQEGLGLMALPPETCAALIEVQTMGVLAKAAPAPRKPTRIDATMMADFVDAVLHTIEEALAETEAVIWAGGFRYASYLDDPRPLGLLLEDISYRVWQAELGFGLGGQRTGKLLWAVPVNGHGHALRRYPGAAEGAEGEGFGSPAQEEAEWQGRLETSVLGAPAVLEAVLHRVTLPLAAVMGFHPGVQLPLPDDALENIGLEGAGRRRLSAARLGQHRGQRAVRLIMGEAEARAEPPASAPKKVVPPPFETGDSPFAGKRLMPPPKGALDRIDSSAYDLAPAAGEGPPPGVALDGFGAAEPLDDLPPLKVGSGF